MSIRIIPRLDIKGPNLVKGINLEGLRVLGKPSDFAKFYYNNGADELLYMDVVASLYERNSLHKIIEETASQIFIPLTVGGGIRTIEDISQVLKYGADKVLMNTAAIKNPNIIQEAALKFGSSTIVIAIESIRQNNGEYFCFTDNGREYTGLNVLDWAQQIEKLGAGEIVLTSVDKDGTGEGFDSELINSIINLVNIPIIIHGGCACKEDILNQCLSNPEVEAFSIASMFHYNFLKNYNITNLDISEGNVDYIKKKEHPKNLDPIGIQELKIYLEENGIKTRI